MPSIRIQSQHPQPLRPIGHPTGMAARRFLVAVCVGLALSSPGASAFGQTAPQAPAAKPQTVPVRAYNEKGQLTGSGWAIPWNDAYLTARSLLANAYRVELVFPDEMR